MLRGGLQEGDRALRPPNEDMTRRETKISCAPVYPETGSDSRAGPEPLERCPSQRDFLLPQFVTIPAACRSIWSSRTSHGQASHVGIHAGLSSRDFGRTRRPEYSTSRLEGEACHVHGCVFHVRHVPVTSHRCHSCGCRSEPTNRNTKGQVQPDLF